MTNKGNNLQCIFQASFLFDSDTASKQQAAQRSKKAWTAYALHKSGCRIGKVLWGRGRAAWQSAHIPAVGETRSEFWIHLAGTAPFGLDCKEVSNLYRKQTVKRQHGVIFIPKEFIFRCVISFLQRVVFCFCFFVCVFVSFFHLESSQLKYSLSFEFKNIDVFVAAANSLWLSHKSARVWCSPNQ